MSLFSYVPYFSLYKEGRLWSWTFTNFNCVTLTCSKGKDVLFFFIFMITHCFQPTCQPDYQLYNHLNMDLLEHNTKKQIKNYQTIIKTLIQHMAPTPIKKFLSSYVARIFFLVSQSSDFLQRFCAANTSITFNE